MRKFLIACTFLFTTSLIACPDCSGDCDETSKLPKIEVIGDFIIYTDICSDLIAGKDAFIINLIEFNVIESEADIIVWDKDMIVLKSKKKDTGITTGKILNVFEERIPLDDKRTAVITVTCELVQ